MMDKTKFSASFFKNNRQELYKKLKPNSLLALSANKLMQRSLTQAYAFEQESNFWYLTGIDEANWILLVDIDSREEVLISPDFEEYQKVFYDLLSADDVSKTSGIDRSKILAAKEGQKYLDKLISKKKTAYILEPMPKFTQGFYTNPAGQDLADKLKDLKTQDIRLTLARQRSIKQSIELDAMQEAIDVTIDGINAAVIKIRNASHEYHLEAEINHTFRNAGFKNAFDPVVASGKNACFMHYESNNSKIQPPSILFDVGARNGYYPADISRTIMLDTENTRHLQIFDAVADVQKNTIQLLKPGVPIKDYISGFENIMFDKLKQLNLIKSKEQDPKAIYKWMPHAISHGLGLDVHDPLGKPEKLVSGMVLTVEPGIYIPQKGLGIRIEDDILISEKGPIIMSSRLPTKLF